MQHLQHNINHAAGSKRRLWQGGRRFAGQVDRQVGRLHQALSALTLKRTTSGLSAERATWARVVVWQQMSGWRSSAMPSASSLTSPRWYWLLLLGGLRRRLAFNLAG